MDTLGQILMGIALGAVLLGLIMFINRVDNYLREMAEKLGIIDSKLEALESLQSLLEIIETHVSDIAFKPEE